MIELDKTWTRISEICEWEIIIVTEVFQLSIKLRAFEMPLDPNYSYVQNVLIQWRIQDFPPTRKVGAPTYYLAKIFPFKLHEIERNWIEKGVHIPSPLDLPI